jgi:hypothetical protein
MKKEISKLRERDHFKKITGQPRSGSTYANTLEILVAKVGTICKEQIVPTFATRITGFFA